MLSTDESVQELHRSSLYPGRPSIQHQALPCIDSKITVETVFLAENALSQNVNVDFAANSSYKYVLAFVFDSLPRQIYLNLLLRLPYLYFSRVTRIFEEAEMSMPMIRQGILDAARANAEATGQVGIWGQTLSGRGRGWGFDLEPARDNAAYNNLQATWLAFIDALLQEWKTLNIISVLLLSAILTILEIQSTLSDPLTRSSALLSMICALMSLVYGCIYIVQFATMKKTYKGAAWAQEAQRSKTGIWWNIWVMLAMPATWLAWSLILFIVTITAFVWRSSPFRSGMPPDFSPLSTSPQILVPRILITTVLSLGILYFILIAFTLRRYGAVMDRAWQKRILGWMECAEEEEDVDVEVNRYPATPWHTQLRQKKDPQKGLEAIYGSQKCCGGDITQPRYNVEGLPRTRTCDHVQRQAFPNITYRRAGGEFVAGSCSPKIISHPPFTSLVLDPAASVTCVLSRPSKDADFDGPGQVKVTEVEAYPYLHRDLDGPNFLKLCEVPLWGDFLDIKPSEDDLKKCGFGLDAFNFWCREGNGWQLFKEHIRSVFDDPPNTIRHGLWLVLDLWTAKLQFNGVTGFLASCEPRSGDRSVAIYFFCGHHDDSSSPPESAHVSG